MEEWRDILEFPGYSVSDYGYVRNEDTGRLMTLHQNQTGVVNVSLMRNRTQYKRGVANLVATTFMERRPQPAFDSVINLDGDRLNNRVDNLLWRPKWFTIKYFQQFRVGRISYPRPIEDLETEEPFESSWDAATRIGLLDQQILSSVMNREVVWPTQQRFRPIR
ncbi:HNH endonuclease [Streptomyces phage RosaAsantewaa]|nr:HNH endonuclease [Streptomyces phage RosaAsantewaa]